MMRKRITFRLWCAFSALHPLVVSLVYALVVILDVADIINLVEYVAGTVVMLLLGTPVFGAAWALAYVDRYNHSIPDYYCKTCGYNLTGNVSGICPECGVTIG